MKIKRKLVFIVSGLVVVIIAVELIGEQLLNVKNPHVFSTDTCRLNDTTLRVTTDSSMGIIYIHDKTKALHYKHCNE